MTDMRSMRFGAVEVIALCDGQLALPPDALRLDPGTLAARLAEAPGDPLRIDVTCFAIRAGGRVALVDAGAGGSMGPGLGALPRRLGEAGIVAEDIDTVLLTHIHPDHSNGLCDDTGTARFPRAELAVQAADLDFWCDPAKLSQGPEPLRQRRAAARRATGAYGDRLRPLTGAAEVFPGVTALPLPGHTPGHCGYLIDTGGAPVVIWGDTVHVAAVQVGHPQASVAFDIDPQGAVASRRGMFEMAAAEGLAVLGMHLAFPGLARVERAGAGYRLELSPSADACGSAG
jgi:glyoxylase-like metal-dependent hydrolase (beta-lactamase superfamily II)